MPAITSGVPRHDIKERPGLLIDAIETGSSRSVGRCAPYFTVTMTGSVPVPLSGMAKALPMTVPVVASCGRLLGASLHGIARVGAAYQQIARLYCTIARVHLDSLERTERNYVEVLAPAGWPNPANTSTIREASSEHSDILRVAIRLFRVFMVPFSFSSAIRKSGVVTWRQRSR